MPVEISHLNFMANEVVMGGLGARFISYEERQEDEKLKYKITKMPKGVYSPKTHEEQLNY
jgi:hypothetical protein